MNKEKLCYKKTVYIVSSSYDNNNETKDSTKFKVQQQYYSLLIICFICFWHIRYSNHFHQLQYYLI